MPKVTIKNNSKIAIHGLKSGATRKIDIDEHGTPLDLNWRRRIKDSPIDGAITIVNEQPKEKKTSKKVDREG